jgi:His-Xaa-Ser system radical SAM maturase HxsC
VRLTTAGTPLGLLRPTVGRIARTEGASEFRSERIRVLSEPVSVDQVAGYRALLTTLKEGELGTLADAAIPIIHSLREDDHLHDDYIVLAQPSSGFVRTIYRPDSPHNVLFLTERCSSNCLMCSQPPKDKDDTDYLFAANMELVQMIAPGPEYLGITGGEPTLLGERLFTLLASLRDSCPSTQVHMLTNGRVFAWPTFTRKFMAVHHPGLTLGIPLYSDDPIVHNYVVQAQDAFDQTVLGLHELARWNQNIEIRVVLHKVTIQRLVQLAEYIYRNFPFVAHVALMGLEPTGYTPRNKDKLWIDPVEYQDVLEQAVEFLSTRGMNVSIYNLQLCVMRPSLWKFARKSISDWKNIFLPECAKCGKLDQCGGLFQSGERMHSAHIHALPGDSAAATIWDYEVQNAR